MSDTIDVVIEIPRGSRSKYEFDPKSGRLRLDRVLHASVHYPTDYGFIPGTREGDGDPMDVVLVVEEPSVPNSIQAVRPIGMLDTTDEEGPDAKVLAVPAGDPRFRTVNLLGDLAPHWLREIEHFFQTYKALEDKAMPVVRGWRDAGEAWAAIKSAQRAFAEHERRSALAHEAAHEHEAV